MDDLKQTAKESIAAASQGLIRLSHKIHAHPELALEEHRAASWTAELLASHGFEVAAGVAGLDTAFVATIGTGPLKLGFCAEYDALPGIGHACGHNVIAAAAAGAGVALAPLADQLGITVKVFGTPGEEGAGGKITMLEAGVFDGMHAAMMVHPAPEDRVHMNCLAVSGFDVTFTGKEAHAAAFPQEGINAADALTVAQVSIGLLRQHIASSDRIHGITTLGGHAPQIIPARTTAKYLVRAATRGDLRALIPRVSRCFEAGALATGSSVQISTTMNYSEFRLDHELASLYRQNASLTGRSLDPVNSDSFGTGSTDMANVSLEIPAIHPLIDIGSGSASNHQPEFAAFAAKPQADTAIVDGAAALAFTAIDAARISQTRRRLLALSYTYQRNRGT